MAIINKRKRKKSSPIYILLIIIILALYYYYENIYKNDLGGEYDRDDWGGWIDVPGITIKDLSKPSS